MEHLNACNVSSNIDPYSELERINNNNELVSGSEEFHKLLLRGLEIEKQNRHGTWVKRLFYVGANECGNPKLILEKYKKNSYTGKEKGLLLNDIGSIYICTTQHQYSVIYIKPHISCTSKTCRTLRIRCRTMQASTILTKQLCILLQNMGYKVAQEMSLL